MTAVPKLERENKYGAWQRQLPVLATVLLLALCGPRPLAGAESPPTAQEELRAVQILETALSAGPSGAEERRKLEKIYAELHTKHPRDVAVKNGYAEFLWKSGEPARALAMWEAALELEPKNAATLEHLGAGYLAGGEVKKAAGFYARAVESAPQNAAARFTLANLTFLFRHELLGPTQPDEAAVLTRALALFAEASRLEPHNPEYARAHAETFYRLPQPDWAAALVAWQHFAKISPQKDFAQANLARVHLKLGQKEAARACLEKIQSPDYQKVKTRLSERIGSQ